MKNRRSIRLKGYDYSQDGWYFITICSFEFEEIFGEIIENYTFVPNELGEIIDYNWKETETLRKNVFLDNYQIMPNHFHAILVIGDKNKLPNIIGFPDKSNQTSSFSSPKNTLGSIIRGFKGSVTSKYNLFDDKSIATIWQSNYYERIIRNVGELERIRKYIKNNPIAWQKDKQAFEKLLLKMNKF